MKERTIVLLLVAILTPVVLFGTHRFVTNTDKVASTFEPVTDAELRGRELLQQAAREREQERDRDRRRDRDEQGSDNGDPRAASYTERTTSDPESLSEAEKRLARLTERPPDEHALTAVLQPAESCQILETHRRVAVRFPEHSESIRGASLFELDAMINQARRCRSAVFRLELPAELEHASQSHAGSAANKSEPGADTGIQIAGSGFDILTDRRLAEVKYHLQQRGVDPDLIQFPEVP